VSTSPKSGRRVQPPRADTTAVASGGADVSSATAPRRGRRSPEAARQEIIDVARAYVSRHGFEGITIEKIMLGTEIGRSAFYVYFRSIHELAAVFIHELSAEVVRVSAGWFDQEGDPIGRIRKGLRDAAAFWAKNGRMIRALEEASWQNQKLRAVWRDEIAMAPVRGVTEAILRDQASGLIGPMDAREMSVALNRFNMAYLNDRFGNPRRKSKNSDTEKVLRTLERVWVGTLFGVVDYRKKVR
jgi:AcrR family transcriptional regulator